MKTVLKIFYWVIGVLAVLTIIAFLLPKTYKVERTVYIKSDPSTVYALTSNFNLWNTWSAWTKETDSTAVFEITGEPASPGASMKWTGDEFGRGEMVLTDLRPGELVGYDLSFDEGKYMSVGKISIEKAGDSLKVSWTDEGDLGYNPVNRYFGLLMDKMMGPDFAKGLAKLKLVAEMRNTWPKIDEVVIPRQTVIMVLDSAGPKEYESVMAKAYGELYGFLGEKRLVPKGYPFATYIRWDSVTYFSVMRICIPVETAGKGSGRVGVLSIPEFTAARAVYFGAYSKMEPAYRALATYVSEKGLTEAGGPSEIYITSPVTEKDTAKWETHIVFPVK